MPQSTPSYFHLHLVSDATGETLITVSRAVAAQYSAAAAIEHVHALVRTHKQLDRVIADIEAEPGIVLYTLIDPELSQKLERRCRENGYPCLSVLQPVMRLFQAYLGLRIVQRPGAQHTLNADYFKRIDALNYTMMHDDGQLPENWEEADVVIVGVSRTSKTPTSIYLANRGVKTANVPLVPGVPPPPQLEGLRKPLTVGLIASPDRVVEVRQNRILAMKADLEFSVYTDRISVSEEIAQSRRYFQRQSWPVIDVTRRSIEETAAAILSLLRDQERKEAADA